jgi:hypothetical protein
MKSVEGIQAVHILPRATASHRPSRATRWREETHVSNRVEHVSRVGMEPRKVFASRGPARENHPRRPEPRGWETRTGSRGWHAVSALTLWGRPGGGHRGRRPEQADTGRTRERVSASSASCREVAEQWGVHRATTAPLGKARGPAGSIHAATRGDDRDGGTSGSAQDRRHRPLQEQYAVLCAQRRGSSQYSGIRCNSPCLDLVYSAATRAWRYWLHRRGGRQRTWRAFGRMMAA